MAALRRQAILAVSLAALISGILAGPAAAKIVHINGRGVPAGRILSITPRAGATLASPFALGRAGTNMTTSGGPVLHSNQIVGIFWAPSGTSFSSSQYETLMKQYFGDVAHDRGLHTNVYSVAQQYTDGGGRAAYNTAVAGFKDDGDSQSSGCTDANHPLDTCLTDAQIQAELGSLISSHAVPSGANTIYFIFTPQSVHDCMSATPDPTTDCSDSPFGFCGYHGPNNSGTALYAVIPDDDLGGCTGGGEGFPNDANVDPVLSTVSHEHIETVTDPFLNAWADPSGNEIADKCSYEYGPNLGSTGGQPFNQSIAGHPYDLQTEWSNDGSQCLQRYDIPPVPVFGVPGASAGIPVQFDGSRSNDPDGSVTGLTWNFGDGTGATGTNPSHTFVNPGVYTVTLTATDNDGHSTSVSQQVPVADPAPLASFNWSPGDAGVNQTVMFDGGASHAYAGAITTYVWNFGDGTQASGARAGHSYSRAGDYTVSLTVRDSLGMTATQTQRVAIADPVVSITMPRSPVMRKAARFSVRVRGRDPDGDRVTGFRWDFGDGRHASGKTPSHTFGEGGRYAVQLTVTSSDGVTTTIVRSLGVRFVKPRGSLHLHGQSIAAVLANGFKAGYRADEPGRGVFQLSLAGRHGAVLGRLGFAPAVGRGRLVLKLSAAGAARLRGRHRVKVVVRFVLTNPARQRVTVSKTLTLG